TQRASIVRNYSRNILSWHFESRSGIKASAPAAGDTNRRVMTVTTPTKKLPGLPAWFGARRCQRDKESPGRAGARGDETSRGRTLDAPILPQGKNQAGGGSGKRPDPPRPRDGSGLATAQRV